MQLFLDSYGVHLGVKDGRFWVKTRSSPEGNFFAVRDVNAIFLTTGGNVTTDAMRLALEENIPVLLLDYLGHPLGQLWSGHFGSTSLVRRNQALFAEDPQGWQWAASWLGRKVGGQKSLLTRLLKEFPEHRDFEKKYTRAVPVLNHVSNQLERRAYSGEDTASGVAATFRGWEGAASRHYFRCLSIALPAEWRFEGRSFRPALDPFNSLLNYLYGILYALVEVSLMKAGIDPSLAVVHADQYNRPTMVYDFIEPFRPWADEAAFRLCRDGILSAASFEQTPEHGWRLAAKDKGAVARAWFAYLDAKIPFGKDNQKRMTTLDLEAVALASALKKFKRCQVPGV